MKMFEFYFPVVPFIVLRKVALTFKSVDSLRSKQFCRVFYVNEEFTAFWLYKGWGKQKMYEEGRGGGGGEGKGGNTCRQPHNSEESVHPQTVPLIGAAW